MGEDVSRGEELRLRALTEGARSLRLSRRAAELAREAAESAARMAAAQETSRRLVDPESDAGAYAAEAYRRSAACQRAAARLYENYTRQLEHWVARRLARPEERPATRPVFMSAVAEVAGWHGAALALLTAEGAEGLVAASDPDVRTAYELEIALAEGPSWEALRDRTTSLTRGSELERRWPQYGPAVRDLGVTAVASVPINLGGSPGGCVTLLDLDPHAGNGVRELSEAVRALTTALRTREGDSSSGDDGDMLGLKMFEREDFQPALNAAAGVLHELEGYSMADAIALIRAHAFAEDRPVASVADGVIRGDGLT